MNKPSQPEPRILLVEDETILAMAMEDFLQDAGFSVVGPFGCLKDALQAAEDETLDAALLDVNLAGELVFPVATALERRGVPFLLLSGYDERILRRASPHWSHLMKPYRADDVLGRLAGMMEREGLEAPASGETLGAGP